jgi:ArsR family transcriptional regulator, arsenate/arsenite/antimonite-responsive transcriptional repressor
MESTTITMPLAVSALQALGQPARMAIFRLLAAAGPDGITAGDIAHQLDIKPNTLSGHLTILHHAGLVSPTRAGRNIRYAVNAPGLRRLLTWLLQDCCGGSPEICAPVLNRIACC